MLRIKMMMFVLLLLASGMFADTADACGGGIFARARARRQARIDARVEARIARQEARAYAVGYAGCAGGAVQVYGK